VQHVLFMGGFMSKPLRLKQEPIQLVSFSNLNLVDQQYVEMYKASESPEQIFDRKIEALAELLGCDEAEATRIILHSL
jgi:hypothetical protein